MATFGQLPIGQKFRMKRFPREEWLKVAPVRNEDDNQIRYNALALADGRRMKFGHSAACILPPYNQVTQLSPSEWAALAEQVEGRGWCSVTDLHRAMLAGLVPIPPKPGADE